MLIESPRMRHFFSECSFDVLELSWSWSGPGRQILSASSTLDGIKSRSLKLAFQKLMSARVRANRKSHTQTFNLLNKSYSGFHLISTAPKKLSEALKLPHWQSWTFHASLWQDRKKRLFPIHLIKSFPNSRWPFGDMRFLAWHNVHIPQEKKNEKLRQ